jgi:hypothetical protein
MVNQHFEQLRAEKWQRLREMDQAKYTATLAQSREEKLNRMPWLKRKTGLGTRIANALSAIGYTKERHIAIKKKLRLSPTCGCDKREAWLNEVGRSVGIGT